MKALWSKRVAVVVLALVLVSALLPTASSLADPETGTVADIIAGHDGLTTLADLLDAAGLTDSLKGPGPFTVFAPTDAAFAALPPGVLDALRADLPTLRNLLLHHVAPEQLLAADLAGLASVPTALGGTIAVSVVDGDIFLNGTIRVIVTDILASNGIIHKIDAVIELPTAMTRGDPPVDAVLTAGQDEQTAPPGITISIAWRNDYGTGANGRGCDVGLNVDVSDAPNGIEGNIHIWNAFYEKGGDPWVTRTFPQGRSEHILYLGADQSEYWNHEIWITDSDNAVVLSNVLTGVTCNNLPSAGDDPQEPPVTPIDWCKWHDGWYYEGFVSDAQVQEWRDAGYTVVPATNGACPVEPPVEPEPTEEPT
jgi:uncharacterized surface protein with fasciclin (FAS1) repeats